MKKDFDQDPIPVSISGVRFAEVAIPPGTGNTRPPAIENVSSNFPFSNGV